MVTSPFGRLPGAVWAALRPVTDACTARVRSALPRHDLQSTARKNAWSGMAELAVRRRQREAVEQFLAATLPGGVPAQPTPDGAVSLAGSLPASLPASRTSDRPVNPPVSPAEPCGPAAAGVAEG